MYQKLKIFATDSRETSKRLRDRKASLSADGWKETGVAQLLSVRLDGCCCCIRPVTSCTALGLRNSSCFCLFLSLFVRFGSGGLRGWNIFYNGWVPTACTCMLYVLSACMSQDSQNSKQDLIKRKSGGRIIVYNSPQNSHFLSFHPSSCLCC